MNISQVPTMPPPIMHRPIINQQLVERARTTMPAPERVRQAATGRTVASEQQRPTTNIHTAHTATWQFDPRFLPATRHNVELDSLIPKGTGTLDFLHQQARTAYEATTATSTHRVVDSIV